MAHVPLSEETLARLQRVFPGTNRDEAAKYLVEDCGSNLSGCARLNAVELERLRFAALKLSRGRLDKLVDAIALAQEDWRDLLMAADFGLDENEHKKWTP